MIIVTGGAGFIGSNIVKGLNDRGREDVLIVDNLTNMVKFKNIQGFFTGGLFAETMFAAAVGRSRRSINQLNLLF